MATLPLVLVADDDLDVLGLMVRALEAMPCDVIAASDGQSALDNFEQRRPDLLVLDLQMPKWSGIEVARRAKASNPEQYLPVVLVTSETTDGPREEAFDSGIDEYIYKPFRPYELRARVRPLLRVKQLHEDLRKTRVQLNDVRREMDNAQMRRGVGMPVRKDVSILFSDVRNFTQISDQLEPEEVHQMLDDYIGQVAQVVEQYGGAVNKIMGDGVMALFGDREVQPDHSLRALRAATEISERAHALQARMHTILPEAFHIGIGVNSGSAIVGNLGSGSHVDYTAIGASVNLAARLQALSTNNQVVACSSSYDLWRDRVVVRNERRETMKGFAHPVRVADVVGVA